MCREAWAGPSTCLCEEDGAFFFLILTLLYERMRLHMLGKSLGLLLWRLYARVLFVDPWNQACVKSWI